ncbi:sugar phosphate exchanger 3-like [Athalia rosae]|uniref:sugar phosphate exchanger 3-like n=1 Tax=Athalia rosae TaxID=37344 RepID=UPI0006265E5D|nr:sugar phosphate exchanger 3-like [Athalia rosae]
MVSWLPEFFIQRVGFSEYRTELALTIYKIGNLFGCIGFGLTARKETVLLQSLVLLGIGTLGIVLLWVTLSWSFLWSVHLLAIAGFAIGGPIGALSASFPVSLGELDGRKSGGTLVGIINGFGNIGELLEHTILSFVIETYGWNSMFILLINLLVFSAFLVNRAHFATNKKLVNSRQYDI